MWNERTKNEQVWVRSKGTVRFGSVDLHSRDINRRKDGGHDGRPPSPSEKKRAMDDNEKCKRRMKVE